MQWNDIAKRHFNWVDAMGWHNKSALESLALIGSEIGEVAGEVDANGQPTADFGEELADIVLRTMDLAQTEGVDLQAAMAQNPVTLTQGPVHVQLCELMVEFGHWVNTARAQHLDATFARSLGRVLNHVANIAAGHAVDLTAQLERKLAKNAARGTRGRRV